MRESVMTYVLGLWLSATSDGTPRTMISAALPTFKSARRAVIADVPTASSGKAAFIVRPSIENALGMPNLKVTRSRTHLIIEAASMAVTR